MSRQVSVLLILLCCSSNIIKAHKKNQEHPNTIMLNRFKSLETFAKATFFIEKHYVKPENAKITKLINSAIEGMTAKLDPHTALLPPKAFKQLTLDTKGQMGGIGIIVKSKKSKLEIISTVLSSPARKAGIKDGDEIISINNVTYKKLGAEALNLLRGDPGTSVHLKIRRKDENKLREFTITREIINTSSISSQMLSNNSFYTKISSFQENTSQELHDFLKKNSNIINGLILDLRDNPGGLLTEAVNAVDLLIESGLIVSTVGRDQDKPEREFAHKNNSYTHFPIIVLINEGTASAAEIVAGALQDHERALILGTPSFGKGSVQTLIALPNGSGLKLTIATYYTPKDRSIQAKGIQPDIVIAKKFNKKRLRGKKESDLERHITSQDLSDFFSKSGGILNNVKNWPKNLSGDYQIITAFTYLRGWNLFNKEEFKYKKTRI